VTPDAELASLRRANAELRQRLDERSAERDQAVAQQAATADVLQVINSSLGDLAPVFDAILEKAMRLCEAQIGVLWSYDGEYMRASASRGAPPAYVEFLQRGPLRPSHVQRRMLGGSEGFVQIGDITAGEDYRAGDPLPRAAADLGGLRTLLVVPLRKHGTMLGQFAIYRQEVRPFADKQIALLQSFAAQAVIAMENTRLFNETKQALARQTATSDILRVISQSPTDVQPVFDAIVLTAARLLRCDRAFIQRCDSAGFWTVASAGPKGPVPITQSTKAPLDPDVNFPSRAIVAKKTLHLPDWSAIELPEFERHIRELHGTNSALYMPLLREGECIGLLAIIGKQANMFGESEIALAESFRDQALIAIENTRLFNDTREALERQTATADILKVIASSPSDVQPVFEAIAERSKRLVDALSTTVFRLEDGVMHLKAFTRTNPEADATLKAMFPAPLSNFSWGEAIGNSEIYRVVDTELEIEGMRELAQLRGYRSMLFVPLLRDRKPIGVIAVTRVEPGPFVEHHVQLLQTFADQAVIAIENVRLFDEVQARTEDLRESLQFQTATSDVLKVISSSPDTLQPVLDVIVETSRELCAAEASTIFLLRDERFHLTAISGAAPPHVAALRTNPISIDQPGSVLPRAVREKRTLHFPNIADDPEFKQGIVGRGGPRALLVVPLLLDDQVIGAIVLRKSHLTPFTERQIDVVQTFADQAVIAISNVRLFEEVQAKTRDLTEALTYQTGSGNILKVIASSPTDVGPVLNAIVESACDLCEADDAIVHLRDGDDLRYAAHRGSLPVGMHKRAITRNFVSGRAVIDKTPIHLPDVFSSEGAEFPEAQEMSRRLGIRTLLSVPLLRENESIGTILLRRTEVNPFSDKQIALLQTFADQAVIAIGNVRLFDEVQARTRDLSEALTYQTGSGNILKVIASSPTDVGPVLRAIVESACELCDAVDAIVLLNDGDSLRTSAHHGPIPLDMERWPISRNWVAGRAFLDRKPAHVHDLLSAEGDEFPETRQRTARTGTRSILSIPLLREGKSIGTIVLRRTEVHPFSDKQIALLQTFADQAVIAIGNVRMFEQVQERTKELSFSLDELRTAQDRLVQTEKLASLGQLTAGIAHEIKNPLNFVNNFAALSAELTDELNDVLKPVALAEKIREEIDDLTQLLKDNLQKVVQHGKRADSIVKNMLLHSREGSGEHRPADINALLDESLNLAYHGARAEKPQFNVTLQRNFDEAAGTVEVFPQEITRVFLNLISNGFYAVTKRKTEMSEPDFDPLLTASTRQLGDAVEIRIRDNGTGIPAEVKEKMFNPFFTTKPAGEGTGLGLSMSHDIIVKQHGGTIDVETEPGRFTEFRIVLPRTSHLQEKKRGER
jgi:two-component system, NtrC family, sensor kinase